MFREICRVLENAPVAPGHYALTLRSGRIARNARPGQFLQILCADSSDPLLPRPFSFLDAEHDRVSFLYHVVGKGTQLLSQVRPGEDLRVTGPLGHGFSCGTRRVVDRRFTSFALVGGGVGIPPLHHLAKTLVAPGSGVRPEAVHVFVGARERSLLLCEKEFKRLEVKLHVATDDGSKGHKGYVTEVLDEFLSKAHPLRTRVYACGPTPMLRAANGVCARRGVECEVSVEVPMACGFGACIGCAIKVKDTSAGAAPDAYRYALACQEGPVFKGGDLAWE